MRISATKLSALRKLPALKKPPIGRCCLGFTLLELLVVLVIIAIASSLVIPSINSIGSSTFQAEIRKGVAVLNYAKRSAIVKSTPQIATFLHFDSSGPNFDDYLLMKQEFGANAAVWESENITLSFEADNNNEAKVEEKIGISFYPEGGSSGGIIHFALDDRSGSIRINAITGKITSQLYDQELQ